MPRKTRIDRAGTLAIAVASMRPRPDAAENFAARALRLVRAAASMRPRPDAAENGVPAAGAPRNRAPLQ